MQRVEVNPNIRIPGNQTYVRLEDFERLPVNGETVMVYQEEYGIVSSATVISQDSVFAYLSIDWANFFPACG